MTAAAICATREVVGRSSFYRGEQYDADLGLYYLRARYYNPATGRFLSRDPEDRQPFDSKGEPTDPKELHKYLYADGDPINRLDPTGRGDDLVEDSEIWAKITRETAEELKFRAGTSYEMCLQFVDTALGDMPASVAIPLRIAFQGICRALALGLN
jgi:RHS repeat-associated protein